jgi:hypothetical protein
MTLPSDHLLRVIHPYGDTIFNMVQLEFLIQETEELEQSGPSQAEMLRLIRQAADEQ